LDFLKDNFNGETLGSVESSLVECARFKGNSNSGNLLSETEWKIVSTDLMVMGEQVLLTETISSLLISSFGPQLFALRNNSFKGLTFLLVDCCSVLDVDVDELVLSRLLPRSSFSL
jgi:hypothetical protein